jgi:hypothetical protein
MSVKSLFTPTISGCVATVPKVELKNYGRPYVATPSLFGLSAFSIASYSYPTNRDSKAE